MEKCRGIIQRAGCAALLLCSFLPAALQAAKSINSADASFSVAAPEPWSPDFNGAGPVVRLKGGYDKKISVERAVTPAAPAALADGLMRKLEAARDCVQKTSYGDGRPQEEKGTLQVSTLTLRPDWPAAYALTGACVNGELPAIFFSDGKDSFSVHCRFSELKTCAAVAAGVGPAVPKAEAACVAPAELSVSGLRLTLPPAACKVLNGVHENLRGALVVLLYLIAPIPFILLFYVFSMLFYQSLAAGGVIAFLAGWLLAGRPGARLLLLLFAVFAGLFFSWDSTGIPQFGLRYHPGLEYCVAVAEGWLTSALVILAGCLGAFGARRYAAGKKTGRDS